MVWSVYKNNESVIRTWYEWLAWFVITVGLLLIIFGAFFYYYRIYKKENRKILTLKKLPILSLFFSIFIIQSLITRFIPNFYDLIPFSLDSITVMAIGFIFGPLEAIIYGFVADFTRTLINGWTYQIISATIFPFIGLISGIFGRKYMKVTKTPLNIDRINEQKIDYKKKEASILNNKLWNFIIFQIILWTFVLISIFGIYYLTVNDNLPVGELFIVISATLLVFLVEIIYFYIFYKNSDDLALILLILISVVISRTVTSYVIRPYSLYFYYGTPFGLSVLTRMATSSYLVPAEIITLYFILKASFNSINLIYN